MHGLSVHIRFKKILSKYAEHTHQELVRARSIRNAH
jgi:hypothetical protein